MVGLPEVEHHEVRQVDEEVDRPLADGEQQMPEPVGRARGAYALDHESHITRALGRFDRNGVGRGRARRRRRQVEGLELSFVDRGDFAGEAAVAPEIRAMGERFVVDLDHPVLEVEGAGDRCADRRVRRQYPDAVVVVADAQLAGRADHAEGLDTADLRALDREIARELRADPGDGDLLSRRDVGRAADDLEGLAFSFADVDTAERELLGIRMSLVGDDMADDDVARGRCEALETFDFGCREREIVAERLGRDAREIDVAREPAQ